MNYDNLISFCLCLQRGITITHSLLSLTALSLSRLHPSPSPHPLQPSELSKKIGNLAIQSKKICQFSEQNPGTAAKSAIADGSWAQQKLFGIRIQYD